MAYTHRANIELAELEGIQLEASRTALYNVEVINGLPAEKPSPKRLHQIIQRRLLLMLNSICPDTFQVYTQLDYRCGADLRVPDLMVVSASATYENDMLVEPPLLAIEILSPGQTIGQLFEKSAAYLESGVANTWVIWPARRRAWTCLPGNVVTLSEMLLVALTSAGELAVSLDELFENLPDEPAK